MKPTTFWVLVASVVSVAGLTATWKAAKPQRQPLGSEKAAPVLSRAEPVPNRVNAPPAMPTVEASADAGQPGVTPGFSVADESFTTNPKTASKPAPATAPKKVKEPPRDPVARVALAFVGADRDAEAYWCEAINDPALSEHERSDLIEDLNEDGLSDSKHPTLDDLPLIINRLRLIQELAPAAMDQVNYAAFAEAYKDLVNLADVALGGGRPVR